MLAFVLLAQLAGPMHQVAPVLAFPERGLDDAAAYRGYQTRLFRDAAGNTVQIYLDHDAGRIVHLLADAENESIGLTPSDDAGRPVAIVWDGAGAAVGRAGRARVLEHRLAADVPRVRLDAFLLGSMRVERDFQYARQHARPFGGTPFVLPEYARLVAALESLAPAERRRHLALLGAADLAALRARLRPTISARGDDTSWSGHVVQPSLDGRDTLELTVRTDPRRVASTVEGDAVTLRALDGARVPFTLRIATRGTPLTPVTREEIFDPAFLDFLAAAARAGGAGDSAALRARWLERQVRGLELLVSREKLMAGLPNYATYFGRDMLLSALMMRSIWRDEMSELAIASALRKLSPRGDVSHEEALGGQAMREAAGEYATLIEARVRAEREGRGAAADSLLAHALVVLHDRRRVRENYHMIDDEFQLPVLAARWLADADVPAARKRAFLADSADAGEPRLRRLLRALALTARTTAAYATEPTATNLVSFPARDSARWGSASWRDSEAGYGGGRYAMDVNAIWVPHALVALQRILATLDTLGIPIDSAARSMPELDDGAPLRRYVADPRTLRQAIAAWRGASRHFVVRLGPDEVRARVAARLAALPAAERAHWAGVLAATGADRDSLEFLALALDAAGRPIGVANTDPATWLFLSAESPTSGAADDAGRALRAVRLFVRPFPVGLFVDRVGPVVANDAYAPPAVWTAFERDRYHGPRVVWGREVNLFLLGAAGHVAAAGDDPARAASVRELRDAIERVRAAVAASGFRSELWSYELRDGGVAPVRYGTGSDVQLWSTTDLAVQFALSRLRR